MVDLAVRRDSDRFSSLLVLFRITLYSEGGLFVKFYNGLDEEKERASRAEKVVLIGNVEQYIAEYSGFSDLDLANFRFIFLYYALFCSLVFAAFCAHHLVKFIRKFWNSILLQLNRETSG